MRASSFVFDLQARPRADYSADLHAATIRAPTTTLSRSCSLGCAPAPSSSIDSVTVRHLLLSGLQDRTYPVREEDSLTCRHTVPKNRADQKGHYQTTALETCSRTYGPKTEWLVEADCDEFYVVTEAMTALPRSRSGGAGLTDIPQRPLAGLLAGNWLFKSADAVVISRLTWKNAGIDELPPDASVLASQTLRYGRNALSAVRCFG